MLVRRSVRVAVEVQVWPAIVRVHMQVPASPRVAPDHRPTQRDKEQRDQQVGGGREARRQVQAARDDEERHRDRKSTRLNSSHSQISYAVFCLKKKTIV